MKFINTNFLLISELLKPNMDLQKALEFWNEDIMTKGKLENIIHIAYKNKVLHQLQFNFQLVNQIKNDKRIDEIVKNLNNDYPKVFDSSRYEEIDNLIRQISKLKKEHNLNFFMVKGAYFKDYYLKLMQQRYRTDIDLWFPTQYDCFIFINLLKKQGYIISETENWLRIYQERLIGQVAMKHPVSQIKIDMHFGGYPINTRQCILIDELDSASIGPEEHFLVILVHAKVHGRIFTRDLNDISMVLQNHNINHSKLKQLCQKFNVVNLCKLYFYLLYRMNYIGEIPEQWQLDNSNRILNQCYKKSSCLLKRHLYIENEDSLRYFDYLRDQVKNHVLKTNNMIIYKIANKYFQIKDKKLHLDVHKMAITEIVFIIPIKNCQFQKETDIFDCLELGKIGDLLILNSPIGSFIFTCNPYYDEEYFENVNQILNDISL